MVDDDAEMRMLIRDFLTSQGYQVEVFSYPAGAINALKNGDENGRVPRYAAVVSDIKMGGGMNGMDFLRLVKSQYPDLPVLLITAYGNPEQKVVAKKAGAFEFLTKPFPLSLLANALQQALGKAPE